MSTLNLNHINTLAFELNDTIKNGKSNVIPKGDAILIKSNNSKVLKMTETSMLDTIIVKNNDFDMTDGLFESGELFSVDAFAVELKDRFSALICADDKEVLALFFIDDTCSKIATVDEFTDYEQALLFSAIENA